MLSKRQVIDEFNSTRAKEARTLPCHAPFSSINFTQSGDMLACCYNRTEILGTYPSQSIQDAWEGQTAEKLRGYMRKEQLGGGCENCQEQIFSGNYAGAKSTLYDEYAAKEKQPLLHKLFSIKSKPILPKVFEFEISNTCNLECTMCNGFYSSAIRANRENLPKLHSPYDDAFTVEIKQYLPNLVDAKFLGGEPFMISQYYDIWDSIIDINPQIKVHITTNGTVLNKRAKGILEKMNAGIVISVDSLNPNNYEAIRVNADFTVLMENIRWFIDYRNRKGLYLTFAICPMVSNVQYLTDIIEFCNENEISIHFNTVWMPKEESLKYAPNQELRKLINDLSQITFKNTPIQHINSAKTHDLKVHLQVWEKEQDAEKENFAHILSLFQKDRILNENAYKILHEIIAHYEILVRGESQIVRLGKRLENIAEQIGHEEFTKAFGECLLYAAEKILAEKDWDIVKLKVEEFVFIPPNMTAETLNKSLFRNFDFMVILFSLEETHREKFEANLHHLRST